MDNSIVLIVSLRVEPSQRNHLRDTLIQLFDLIRREETFVTATLHDDLEDDRHLLVYEVWRETRESFLASQLSKPYRANYEKQLLELNVERTGNWLKPAASWNSTAQPAPISKTLSLR